eukprot:scaffold321664_cov19-Prasinocladus_malaysianus.AAC.1
MTKPSYISLRLTGARTNALQCTNAHSLNCTGCRGPTISGRSDEICLVLLRVHTRCFIYLLLVLVLIHFGLRLRTTVLGTASLILSSATRDIFLFSNTS